jgi:hypothetical protein
MRPCQGNFHGRGKRKTPLFQVGEHALIGRYYTFICSFGRYIGGTYVDGATTDSVLKPKMPSVSTSTK